MSVNLDDLTLGQIKQLQNLSGRNNCIANDAIGKYVIIRSRNEGINAGFLLAADETGCVLGEARRIWYHKPKDSSVAWYEGVAETGLHKDSKISCKVERKYLLEDYSITLCSDAGAKSIQEKASYES